MPHLFTEVCKPVVERLTVEYNRTANKLRIGDINDKTLAVYSNGAVYRVLPQAGPGCVIIATDKRFPNLVQSLEAQKLVEIVQHRVDKMSRYVQEYYIVRVLIPSATATEH